MSTEQDQRHNLIGNERADLIEMQLMSTQDTHETNPTAELGIGLSEQLLRRFIPTESQIGDYSLKVELKDDARQIVIKAREEFRESSGRRWLDAVARNEFPKHKRENSWGSTSGEVLALTRTLNTIPESASVQFLKDAATYLSRCSDDNLVKAGPLLSKIDEYSRQSKVQIDSTLLVEFSQRFVDALFAGLFTLKDKDSIEATSQTVQYLDTRLNKTDIKDQRVLVLNALLNARTFEKVAFIDQLNMALEHQQATGFVDLSSYIVEKATPEIALLSDHSMRDSFVLNYTRASLASLNGITAKWERERSADRLVQKVCKFIQSGVKFEIDSWLEADRMSLYEVFLQTGHVSEIAQIASLHSTELRAYAQSFAKRALDEEFDIALIERLCKTFDCCRDQFITDELLRGWDKKIDELISEGKKEEAATLAIRHDVAGHYKITGGTLESISTTMNIVSGKIMLIEIQDGAKSKMILRGFYKHSVSENEFHRDIMEGFKKEMKYRGLQRLTVSELGGAHISVPEGDATIKIYGKSEDFGECDKQLALALLKKAFPTRTIEIGK